MDQTDENNRVPYTLEKQCENDCTAEMMPNEPEFGASVSNSLDKEPENNSTISNLLTAKPPTADKQKSIGTT